MHDAPGFGMLRAVADALAGGSVNVFDREFRYLYAAGSGLQTVHLEPAALIGRTVADIFGADAAALVVPQYARAFAGERVTFDLDVFGRTFSATATPLSGNPPDMILVLVQDVTTLRAEAGEHERNEAFVATVAHELRQPIDPLRIALERMKGELDPQQKLRLVNRMERQLQRLERLVADLGNVGRPEESLNLQVRALDLATALADEIRAVRHVAHSKQQEMVWELSQPLPVLGDEGRLRQVFSNLLLNAMKYTPEGGRIDVRGQHVGDQVIVTVTDTGVGIDEELLPRIFDLFVRGDSRQGGMGIGLNVVRRLIDAHGGRVSAESDGPLRGSCFRVVLPATGPAA